MKLLYATSNISEKNISEKNISENEIKNVKKAVMENDFLYVKKYITTQIDKQHLFKILFPEKIVMSQPFVSPYGNDQLVSLLDLALSLGYIDIVALFLQEGHPVTHQTMTILSHRFWCLAHADSDKSKNIGVEYLQLFDSFQIPWENFVLKSGDYVLNKIYDEYQKNGRYLKSEDVFFLKKFFEKHKLQSRFYEKVIDQNNNQYIKIEKHISKEKETINTSPKEKVFFH